MSEFALKNNIKLKGINEANDKNQGILYKKKETKPFKNLWRFLIGDKLYLLKYVW